MSGDYTGRIAAIVRAFRDDDPEDIVSGRLAIREILHAERSESYHEGHRDGVADQRAASLTELRRLAKAHETFVQDLLGQAPGWAAEGTPEESLAALLRTALAVAERHLGRLPVRGDVEPESSEAVQ